MGGFWTVLSVVEALWVAGLVAWIVLERRSPVSTLAWILALAWLPAIGIAVYYLVGPRRLLRRKRRRKRSQRLVSEALDSLESETGDPARAEIARLLVGCGESPPMRTERVDLYTEGQPCFEAMLEAVANAQHHVHLSYYIWSPDETGTRFRDALVDKARQGVKVRLLLDLVGSYDVSARFFAPLEAASGQVTWFNPVSLTRWRPRSTNFRTHRKIVVCDGRVAFTGGMNVSNTQTAEATGTRAWRDTHVSLEGAAVHALQRVFLEDWHYASDEVVAGSAYLPRASSRGEELVQIAASGPDGEVESIHKLFFAAIASAHRRVLITTPYFVPDEAITAALVSAAMRGVEVKLLVPAHGDNVLADLAARSYFPELLSAGVEVHEYAGRFIHAKTIVVDADLALVGSANIDNRSFRLNFEVCAAVYGASFTARLAAAFEDDLAESRPVKPRSLARAPFVQRLGESAARLLSPML